MMGDPLDMRQIFFTNLQLLGLNAEAEGMDNKIQFNKFSVFIRILTQQKPGATLGATGGNMFDLPNKRGSEVVLHFLFDKLNPVMSREEFRHCWPIIDKQQEAQFRRTCNDWLNNISKNEPDSHLPRITGSLFLSPGGEKFVQLLLHLSRYVLQQEVDRMGGKDHIRYPELTQQTIPYSQAIGNSVQCSMVRNRKFLLDECQIILALNREWKEYSNELVKENRKLSKLAREKDHGIREEIQKVTERGAARGSPMVRKRRSTNTYEYDFDPQSIKRAQRVQEVRDLWKQFDDFCAREASEREVIESIVDKTMHKYKISASDVNIKVPDMLLTECEDEIRKRHVDSNFHHGKLNLVSIIQLWNLCLHLYVEKLHQAGVPKFENEVKSIKDRVHTSHAYLSNTQSLKEQITSILPELKESIEYLRDKIDKEVTTTPHSLRTTSVGLGLMEPSPPVSFTPRKTDTTPEGASMKLTPDDITTPEAVDRITDEITGTVRKGPNSLFQGTPVYARSVKQDKVKTTRISSKLPKKSKTENSNSRTVDVRSQLHSTPTRTRQITHYQDWDGKIQQPETLISQIKESPTRSEKSFHSERNESIITQSSGTMTLEMSPRSVSGPSTPRNQSFQSPLVTPRQGQRSPSDMIVDEVMGLGTVMSPVMSGAEAFRTMAEIPRSPIGLEVKMMFKQAMSNEISPKSDKSWSSRGKRSAEHSFNSSNYSSKSHQEQLNNSKRIVSDLMNTSLNASDISRRSAFEPPLIDELLPSNHMNNSFTNNQGRMSNNKGSVGSELELLDNLNSREDILSSENRPKSPVGEILDQFESDQEDNLVTQKLRSTEYLNRPTSPVAEFLDSIESDNVENEEGLQQDSSNKFDEEDEFYLEQPEDLLTSEGEEDNLYGNLSTKLVDEHRAIITNEILPRSPLKDEIRRMFKEAVSDIEDSPLNRSGNRQTARNFTRANQDQAKSSAFSSIIDQFDVPQHANLSGYDFGMKGVSDVLVLEDIEMPDMPLDDSFGQSGTLKNNDKKLERFSVRESVGPDLISFASPRPDFNVFETYDAKKLDKAKHDLDEIFNQSLPLRLEHVRQTETKQELNTNKTQLQQLEKSIGEIEGKILELSSNDLLNPLDDSDIIDNLDDSFAPLKGGFLVEGGTPSKSNTVQGGLVKQDGDIRTRMQQLKDAASKIKSNYLNSNDSHS